MHIFSKDQQAFHLKRTHAEKWFTRINTLLVAVQLACFLCALIRTSMNASNSMQNSLFSTSSLVLNRAFLVPGCTYEVTRSHAFFRNVTYVMTPDNVGYYVSRGVLNIRYLMAITGVHMVVSAINRVWFETNTHELRYHFVVFRKDMVTTWEILLMIIGIVMTIGITEENKIMQEYLQSCSDVANSYYCSVLPYIELYISYFISVGVTAINLLVALWNLSKPNPRDQLMKEEQARQEEIRALAERYHQTITNPTGNGGTAPGDYSGAGGGTKADKDRPSSELPGGRDELDARQDVGDDMDLYDDEAMYDHDGDVYEGGEPNYDEDGMFDENVDEMGHDGAYDDDEYYDGDDDGAAYDEDVGRHAGGGDDYAHDMGEVPVDVDEPLDGDFGKDDHGTAGAGSSNLASPLGLSSGPPPALTSFEAIPSAGNSGRGRGARHFPPPTSVDEGSEAAVVPPPGRPARANKMLAPPTPLEGHSGDSTERA